MAHHLASYKDNQDFHKFNRSNNVRRTSYTVTLKLRELQIKDHGLIKATLRVGWMSSQMSVFTHWKNVENGKVGWKSSLVQTVTADNSEIALVIYQKVGDCEMPIGVRRIPCGEILSSDRKHLFKISVENMVKGEAELLGSIRSKLAVPDLHEDNMMAVESRDGSTVSSRSSGTGRSIDMSIDLTMEIPTVFFPLITAQEVYRCIIVKHYETSNNQDLFKRVLMSLLHIPDNAREYVVSNVCHHDEISLIDDPLYKELEITLNAAFGNDGSFSSFHWNVSRTPDFKALKEVITLFLQRCEAGGVPRLSKLI